MTEKVLLIGCGSSRDRRVKVKGKTDWSGQELVTLDSEPQHGPDIIWDLRNTPWCATYSKAHLDAESFDEIHAYEVLEHVGSQGDYVTFFRIFGEIWRLLKPEGRLAATVPHWRSMWAWGDPGHTWVINLGTLVFLDQQQYKIQVDDPVTRTPMSDYRSWWRGDFELMWSDTIYNPETREPETFRFILRAVKPSRYQPSRNGPGSILT